MLDTSSTSTILIRRSMVTGAANNAEHRETAWLTGADAVMLDLEDTVPAAHKDVARAALREAVPTTAESGADVLVRVNAFESRHEDLDAAVWPGLHTVVVPKVESPDELLDIGQELDRLEPHRGIASGSIRLAVTIESVRGYALVDRILPASPRVLSVTLGTEDFTHDIGAEPTATGEEVLLPQLQLVLSARLASVTPLFGVLGSLATVGDLKAVRSRARWARDVGFAGSACSAHSHVAIANEVFRPSPSKVHWARTIIDAYAEATSRGDGRIHLDGAVVDTPVVLRAEQLLRWEKAVVAADARKHATQAAQHA